MFFHSNAMNYFKGVIHFVNTGCLPICLKGSELILQQDKQNIQIIVAFNISV